MGEGASQHSSCGAGLCGGAQRYTDFYCEAVAEFSKNVSLPGFGSRWEL